jgi:hypothetical protein
MSQYGASHFRAFALQFDWIGLGILVHTRQQDMKEVLVERPLVRRSRELCDVRDQRHRVRRRI